MTIPDQIDAIKEQYPDYWRSEEALRAAIAVWGAEGHVNDCGVFCGCETETVAKSGRAVAQVSVYKLREGVFVHACHFTSATSGFSYAPSVWGSVPHETEKEARRAGIAELLESIGKGERHSDREDLRQVRRQLQREIAQPSLF